MKDDVPVAGVRDRIVAVAARHFAEHGLQGASQRAILREVGVNNSTSNYYFGSKEALYRAVVDEAVNGIQAQRIASLEQIDRMLLHGDQLRAILAGYMEPYLREAGSDVGYHYMRIVAMLHLGSSNTTAARVIEDRITPVRDLYVDALARLFPETSRNRIYHVLSLAVGVMVMAPFRFAWTELPQATVNQMIEEVVTVATLTFESLCRDRRGPVEVGVIAAP